MPASVIPIASTTATQPSGMASMAARVDRGDDQDSGVARSSRIGTNRIVKAAPTTRGEPGRSGRQPRIQTLRSPFFSKIVVIVAVDTPERVCTTSRASVMDSPSNAGDQATVNTNDRSGDVRGAAAGEKRDRIGVLFRLTIAADGNRSRALGRDRLDGTPFPFGLGLVQKTDSIGRDASGQDDVRCDSIASDLACQRLGPADERKAERVGKTEIWNRRDYARRSAGNNSPPR